KRAAGLNEAVILLENEVSSLALGAGMAHFTDAAQPWL
ncbi:hypothetical protein Pgy4_40527, partial [Pseudomonas savastanoi pv. glycinea str. race 4]